MQRNDPLMSGETNNQSMHVSGITGSCTNDHMIPHLNGYSCCGNPTSALNMSELLTYDDAFDLCPQEHRVMCPELPDGRCAKIGTGQT